MVDVLIVAAGSGSRMKSNKNKQFLEINEKPILAWTIDSFYKNTNVDNILLAIRKEDESEIKKLLSDYSFENIQIVYGGAERQDSIRNCINKIKKDINYNCNNKTNIRESINNMEVKDMNVNCNEDINIKKSLNKIIVEDMIGNCNNEVNSVEDSSIKNRYLLIHDGARPFISQKTINQCIEEVIKNNAVCVGVKSKDTLKIVDDDKYIKSTPERKYMWCAQTPQAFRLDIIISAYEESKKTGFLGTDDASLVENLGIKVKMVEGEYTNIKITTPDDLMIGEIIAKASNK